MNNLTPQELDEQSKLAIITCLQDSKIKLECYEKDSADSEIWKLDSKNAELFDGGFKFEVQQLTAV